MRTCLVVSLTIILLISGCSSSAYKKPDQMPVVYVDDVEVDGIVLKQSGSTPEFIQSLLGAPSQIDAEGRRLRYTDHGFDFWFSRNNVLSEIRLNQGFTGQLDTGIGLSSSKQDVFSVYGAPVDEIESETLSRKNDEGVLYTRGDVSRIYYGRHGLLFWFRNDSISQIVPFKGKMAQR